MSFFKKVFGGIGPWMVHAWQQTKISQNTPQGVKNVVNKAAPYVAAYYTGGLASSAAAGLGASGSALTAATAAGAYAGGQQVAAMTQPLPDTENQDLVDMYNSEKAGADQKELDAKIVSEAAAADKKRRAQMLANSRKGTIKTSPLGLPGGGFAQKQLLGA